MAIDSIGSNTSASSLLRAQSVTQTNSVRNPTVIDAVAQSQQRAGSAVTPVTTFAVAQTNNSGASQSNPLPRGSLVDFLA